MNKLVMGLIVIVLSLVALPNLALAQESDSTQDGTSSNQADDGAAGSNSSNSSDASIDRETTKAERDAARTARIEALKEAATERITQAKRDRISGRCTAAQEKVLVLKTRVDTAIENRTSRYGEISTKLDALLEKLTAAGVDTTSVESAMAGYTTAVNAVLTLARDYSETLDDIANMDCEADPSGFYAALMEARSKRGEIIAASNTVKNDAIPAIKAALKTLRERLADSTEPSED